MFDIETIKRDKEFKLLVKGILQDRRKKAVAKWGKRSEWRKPIREKH
jgi:hypothetical protein